MFREVRLAALRDAPYAFGSTYEVEFKADDAAWRVRLGARTRFVAESGHQVVGTVGGGDSGLERTAALTALWVAPRVRGRGVGEALVRAVVAWAEDTGYERLVLWVVEGNRSAERLYERTGFKRTGAVQPVRPNDDRIEYEMWREV